MWVKNTLISAPAAEVSAVLATHGTMGNRQGKRAWGEWFGTWACSFPLLLKLPVTVDQSWHHRPWLLHPELPWEELAWGLLSCQCILPSQDLR